MVEKLVVQNRGCQPERVLGVIDRVLDANQPSLAEDAAVFLSGDFFRHLKNQLDQRIGWQLLRAMKHHSRLADVLDHALIPGAEVLSPISNWQAQLQTARAWHPGRLLLTRSAVYCGRFRSRIFHPATPPHRRPVILIGGRAKQADLVVLSSGRAPRPGKLVRAAS